MMEGEGDNESRLQAESVAEQAQGQPTEGPQGEPPRVHISTVRAEGPHKQQAAAAAELPPPEDQAKTEEESAERGIPSASDQQHIEGIPGEGANSQSTPRADSVGAAPPPKDDSMDCLPRSRAYVQAAYRKKIDEIVESMTDDILQYRAVSSESAQPGGGRPEDWCNTLGSRLGVDADSPGWPDEGSRP
jgi:hypothetical protein